MRYGAFATARRLALLGAGLALVGCEGGQTGSEWTSGGTGSDELCDVHRTNLTADEVSPLGFALADVIANVSGRRSAMLKWRASDRDLATTPTGMSPFELELAADPASARFVHYALKAAAPPRDAGCPPDAVEFDAELWIGTADGGLAERRSVQARATRSTSAEVVGSLPWSEIRGTFEAAPRSGIVAAAPMIACEIDATSTRGSLSGVLAQAGTSSTSARSTVYACWPADSCGEP